MSEDIFENIGNKPKKRKSIVITGLTLEAEFNCEHDLDLMVLHALDTVNEYLGGFNAKLIRTEATRSSIRE